MISKKCFSIALLLAISSVPCFAQSFTDGQSVEVREGDTWSKATIVKREGRRYQVRYEGSTDEEWVTTERLRAPGTPGRATTPSATPSATPSPTPSAAPQDAPAGQWSVNQSVEVKRGAAWRPAKVEKLENGWVLVLYAQGNYREWVEPWRIRQSGSKDDAIGNAPMNREAKADDPAPSSPPAEAPTPIGGVAGWREPVVGDRVLLLDGFRTHQARIISKRGEEFQVQADGDRNSRWIPAMDARLAGLRLDAKVGQRVQLREPRGWVGGTVMAREADRVRIMIDGWKHEMHHKWASLEEIRPAGAGDVPPVDMADTTQLKQLPGYKEADAASARALTLIMAPGAKYTPDTAAAAQLPPLQFAPIPSAGEQMYTVKGIAASMNGGFAVVSVHTMREEKAKIERVDLKSGEHLGTVTVPVPADMVASDLSPDGMRVLMRDPRTGDRLEIWNISTATPKRELLFFPYVHNQPFFEKYIKFAKFVNDEQLLTIGGKGEMQLWDIRSGRAIYTCAAYADSKPGISPGGKYIAFSTGKDSLIIETATGKAVMDLPLEMGRALSFDFSNDGTELLACDSKNISAVDLTSGKLTHHFSIPGSTTMASIASPRKGFALVDDKLLVELRLLSPVWNYNLSVRSMSMALPTGQLLFTNFEGRTPTLVAAEVPHASAQQKLASVAKRPMLLEPGTAVSLVVNLSPAESERAAITSRITAQLQENGFKVQDNQPIRLVLSIERGQAVSTEYGSGPRFGPFARPSQSVTISPWISSMRLEHNGKAVWQVSSASGGPSPILMLKEGQSAQQAAEDQNKPNTGIFLSTRIPALMVMPTNPMHLYESEFTGRGFQDVPAVPQPDQPATPPQFRPNEINGPVAMR